MQVKFTQLKMGLQITFIKNNKDLSFIVSKQNEKGEYLIPHTILELAFKSL